MKIAVFIEYIASIPKSYFVSFRLCPILLAWKMPIMVRYNCKLKDLSGVVNLSVPYVSPGLVKIGFGDVGIFDKKSERNIIEVAGEIEVKGNVFLGHGSRISVGRCGKLNFGKNFINTARMTVICDNNISFGDCVLVSWDTMIVDTDFHSTIDVSTQVKSAISKPVIIGNNVWIGMRSVILKGCIIPNGAIIGAMSLVNKEFREPNCLIAGNPASIKKVGITRSLDM